MGGLWLQVCKHSAHFNATRPSPWPNEAPGEEGRGGPVGRWGGGVGGVGGGSGGEGVGWGFFWC